MSQAFRSRLKAFGWNATMWLFTPIISGCGQFASWDSQTINSGSNVPPATEFQIQTKRTTLNEILAELGTPDATYESSDKHTRYLRYQSVEGSVSSGQFLCILSLRIEDKHAHGIVLKITDDVVQSVTRW
jgi:hypothetical protein